MDERESSLQEEQQSDDTDQDQDTSQDPASVSRPGTGAAVASIEPIAVLVRCAA